MSVEKPLLLTCPACGKRHRRCASWRFGDYCQRSCYESMPFPRHPSITMAELHRATRQYPCQKRAAEALGVSYVRFRRVIKKLNLRNLFPAHGGASAWAE